MLSSRTQRKIPACLGHHTNFVNLKSILTGGIGKNKEICFWAFSNMHKNDEEEISMGLRLQNIVNEEMSKISHASMFQQAGDYKHSASISFMEGPSTKYMMDTYGHFRLNFDLRKVETFGITNFLDCEYVNKEELDEYGTDYATAYRSNYEELYAKRKSPERYSMSNIDKAKNLIMMDIDLVRKPLIIKETRWQDECEWRKIIEIKDNDDDIYYFEGKPFKKVYYPTSSLIGVTYLFDKNNIIASLCKIVKLSCFIAKHKYLWGKKYRIITL